MNDDEYIRAVRLFYNDIKKVAYVYLKNSFDAEDITQNVFIKLNTYTKDFRDDEHLKKWLVKVAVNECRSLWRSPWKKRVKLDIPEHLTDKKTKDDPKGSVLEAILRLNKTQRQIIHLIYYENLSAKEVGEIMGISENAVFKAAQRARDKIRRFLSDEA